MAQSDLGKEDHRHGTYGEAFCQLNEGNHYATVSETYRGYLNRGEAANKALTVCGPVNLVRDVAKGVHFLLGWGDQTGEFQLIVLVRERADGNILF